MNARRPGRRIAVVAIAALLASCGDSGTEPTPERERIGGGTFTLLGTVEANVLGYNADVAAFPFTLNEGGTVEIVADWGSAANNIDIFLYLGACSIERAREATCPVANRTNAATKPERMSVIGVPSGTYSIGFANFGTTGETGTFEVHVTH
jgi:hypothetical protein